MNFMREKQKSILRISFALMILFIFSYLIIGEIVLPKEGEHGAITVDPLEGVWTIETEGSAGENMTLPYSCEMPSKKGGNFKVSTQLPDGNHNQEWLMFWNRGCNIKAFVGEELRLEYDTKDSRFFGFDSPYCYIFIPLTAEDSGRILTMELWTDEPTWTLDNVYIGDRYSLITSVRRPYVLEIVLATFIFVLGFICLIAGYWMQKFIGETINLIPMGWCVILTSLWIVVNDGIRQFYFQNISVVRDVAYFVAATLPIAFLFYLDEVQKNKHERIYHILAAITVINFAVFTVSYMAGVLTLTLFFKSTVVIIALCVVIIVGLLIKDAVTGELKEYRKSLAGVIIFILSGVAQAIAFAISDNGWSNGVIFEFGLFCTLIIALKNSIQFLLRMYAEKNEALSASAAKARFLANMSHEIRTPINAILGMNEMIMREEGNETILEYSRDIHNAGKSLLALVNDILDFSKIESGKMELVPVNYDVASLLHDCYQMIIVRAKEKNLAFDVVLDSNMPRTLYGDEVRIRQIIINLLTNAVKYTDKGSITLRAAFDPKNEDHIMLRVTVKDTGKGISEENLSKLFIAFQRIDEKKNRNIEGTGLGLNIVQEFVHMMGGEISVDSVYGEGSTFAVKIPQKVIDRTPIGTDTRFERAKDPTKVYETTLVAPKARILVADDVKINLVIFRNLLKKTQIQIDMANSGEEAIRLAETKKYDIIFLDHMMPEMDGIETLQNMKISDSNMNKDTPVIMLTANAIVGAKEEYINQGFTDYLTKPVECEKLERIIRKYLPKEQ